MARMHSRDKGKSGSTKPVGKKVPTWVSHNSKEVEKLVIKLGKEGLSSAKIGIQLRDVYGVPDIKLITGKSVSKILEENKLSPEIPDDLMNLIKKAVKIIKHKEDNNHDMTAKRGLQLTEAKIKRLSDYYKKTGQIPKDWKYDPKRIGLLVD